MLQNFNRTTDRFSLSLLKGERMGEMKMVKKASVIHADLDFCSSPFSGVLNNDDQAKNTTRCSYDAWMQLLRVLNSFPPFYSFSLFLSSVPS